MTVLETTCRCLLQPLYDEHTDSWVTGFYDQICGLPMDALLRRDTQYLTGRRDAKNKEAEMDEQKQRPDAALPAVGDAAWCWQAGKTKGSWVATGLGSEWSVMVAGSIIDVSYSDGKESDLYALLPAPDDQTEARRLAEHVAMSMAGVLAACQR